MIKLFQLSNSLYTQTLEFPTFMRFNLGKESNFGRRHVICKENGGSDITIDGDLSFCFPNRVQLISSPKNKMRIELPIEEQRLWGQLQTSSGLNQVSLLIRLGDCVQRKGNLGAAHTLLLNAIQILKSTPVVGKEEYLGNLFLKLGALDMSRRDYPEAVIHFNESLRLFCEIDSGYKATALRRLADAHSKNGDQKFCLDLYEQVIGTLNPETDLYDFRRDNHSKGLTMMKMCNWEGALQPLLDARRAAERRGDHDSIFDEDVEISHCHFQLKHSKQALTFAGYAMDYAFSIKSPNNLFWAFTSRGNALMLLEKYEEAEELFIQALQILLIDRELNWEVLLLAERNFAKILCLKGERSRAKEIFRRTNTVAEIIESDVPQTKPR